MPHSLAVNHQDKEPLLDETHCTDKHVCFSSAYTAPTADTASMAGWSRCCSGQGWSLSNMNVSRVVCIFRSCGFLVLRTFVSAELSPVHGQPWSLARLSVFLWQPWRPSLRLFVQADRCNVDALAACAQYHSCRDADGSCPPLLWLHNSKARRQLPSNCSITRQRHSG